MDNLMKTANDVGSLGKFKEEATQILANAKFPVHKWESNFIELESEDMPNPREDSGTQLGQERGYAGNSGPEIPRRNSTDRKDHA